jgi:hypothetical protein
MATKMTTHVKCLNIDKNINGTLDYVLTFLKSFLFLGIVSAFLFGVYRTIKIKSLYGFFEGLQYGAILSIVCLPLIFLIDVIHRLKNYPKFKRIDFNVKQERKLLIEDDYHSAFNKFYEVLKSIEELSINKKDDEEGIIEAFTKRSWKSFGEIIKANFVKGTKGKVFITINSRPKGSFTMVDYNKNFENVESIISNLEKLYYNTSKI